MLATMAGSAGENGHAAQHGMANLNASARMASSELSVEGAGDHDRTLAMLQRQVGQWSWVVPTPSARACSVYLYWITNTCCSIGAHLKTVGGLPAGDAAEAEQGQADCTGR